MKLSVWRRLAISSLLVSAVLAEGETRPQYGGILRVTTREVLASLDPSQPAQPETSQQASIMGTLFETLVTIDDRGRPQPCLAISWQAMQEDRRWRLSLRSAVKFHDGTLFTAGTAASSLAAANPSWHVTADADSIMIERDRPDPELLAELALPRNAVFSRGTDGRPVGTGPFYVADWQPGKLLSLAANDDYWAGRPFLDAIEIKMDKSYRDQLAAFQSSKADLIEVAPEQEQRVPIDRQVIHSSLPIECLALVFSREAQSVNEKRLRQALALSIDRGSIGNVLLQGAGPGAASLLPNWMTGYAFVFSTAADLAEARRIRDLMQTIPVWTLSYDGGDPLSRLIAERIVLNAKDAGLSLRSMVTATPDVRLMRIPLDSTDPWIALQRLTAVAGAPAIAVLNDSVENLYAAEQSLLASERIIPLFHLPIVYAISPAVRNCKMQKNGTWNLSDAWLENKP